MVSFMTCFEFGGLFQAETMQLLAVIDSLWEGSAGDFQLPCRIRFL